MSDFLVGALFMLGAIGLVGFGMFLGYYLGYDKGMEERDKLWDKVYLNR